jgi:formate-dependent phosphoribosylglycinamide formyltransferase (GAR transformylase)
MSRAVTREGFPFFSKREEVRRLLVNAISTGRTAQRRVDTRDVIDYDDLINRLAVIACDGMMEELRKVYGPEEGV